MVHRDGDHPAQRQAADMRSVDLQRVHRGEDRGGEIVVVGLAVGRVAVAIAGIVEGDGVARRAEMLELRPPHRLVRADAVEEDDRDRRDLILGHFDRPIPRRRSRPSLSLSVPRAHDGACAALCKRRLQALAL